MATVVIMNDESHEIRMENELKKNEMERILETMRSEIIAILALSPHAGYAWKGTTTDLLEVINAVVMSCAPFSTPTIQPYCQEITAFVG